MALVARCDDSGLGVLSLDIFRNFVFDKVLVVSSQYPGDPDRYNGFEGTESRVCGMGVPSVEDIDWVTDDVDIVLTIETPYNWNVYRKAREKGVKTALMVMYEWLYPAGEVQTHPDLYLCPTKVDFDNTPFGNKKLLQVPVNRNLIKYKTRKEAKTFIFNNGHGGFGGRNSMHEFLNAIPLVKSDVKFKVRTQVPVQSTNDSRLDIEHGEVAYEDLWKEGDIYVHLHKFDGLSLPLNEALAAGFPVMALDIEPHNEYLPKDFLITPEVRGTMKTSRIIDIALVSPVAIAKKIDEIAAMPSEKIEEYSKLADKLAGDISWEALKPKYLEVLNELGHGKRNK